MVINLKFNNSSKQIQVKKIIYMGRESDLAAFQGQLGQPHWLNKHDRRMFESVSLLLIGILEEEVARTRGMHCWEIKYILYVSRT